MRRHMVELHEWRRQGGHTSGLVPFVWRGAQKGIPVWWLEEMIDLLETGGYVGEPNG